MTTKEIEKTLGLLRYNIAYQRHVTGNYDKIRVRMGRELAAWIKGYVIGLIINNEDDTKSKTIFGCPLEIDNENPMCLEVLIVESIPIYREKQPQSSC